MFRNPVKKEFLTEPEDWQWSSLRAYPFQEPGTVKVNFQEWPLTIGPSPTHSFETRE